MASSPAGPGRRQAPALTVAAVARRLGVAPATLRTWDRRYGLGPSEHTAGAHRRYTPADLARLGVMRRLTLEGVAPSEAARAALEADLSGPERIAPVAPLPLPRRRDLLHVDDGAGGGRLPGRTAEDVVDGANWGGGRVVALPDGSPAARGLARAAMWLDSNAVTSIVRDSVARHGVVPTWDDLLVPVLVAVGFRWQATGEGVDVEHLLSECVIGVLRTSTMRIGEPRNARPILLATAEEEQHSLPLHAVAAALAERDVGCRMLGPRVPRDALWHAITRIGPAAVFVWSSLPGTGDPHLVANIPGQRPPPAVVVGGPGWHDEDLPQHIGHAADLGAAVDLLSTAAGV